jgi:hypothetical protein
MILRQISVTIAAGIALGPAGAAALVRCVKGMLFGVTPLDPATFVAVPLLFAAIATAAAYVPARRAASVDPTVALKVRLTTLAQRKPDAKTPDRHDRIAV